MSRAVLRIHCSSQIEWNPQSVEGYVRPLELILTAKRVEIAKRDFDLVDVETGLDKIG